MARRNQQQKPCRTLVSPYKVGDAVMVTKDDEYLRAGDVGTIRKIVVSDPGTDDAFLVYEVKWSDYNGVMPVGTHHTEEPNITAVSRRRYGPRQIAKRVRTLALAGIDVVPVEELLDQLEQGKAANDAAWLRRQLGTLDTPERG